MHPHEQGSHPEFHELPRDGMDVRVAEDRRQRGAVPLVIGVELIQPVAEASLWVGNRAPGAPFVAVFESRP